MGLLERQKAEKKARDLRLGIIKAPKPKPSADILNFPIKAAPVVVEIQEQAPIGCNVPITTACVDSEPKQELYTGPRRGTLSSHAIVLLVARYYKVTVSDIYAGGRVRKLVNARHVAMYLDRIIDRKSYLEVAKDFGRDHTTCLNAFERIEQRLQTEPELERDINLLTARIREVGNVAC